MIKTAVDDEWLQLLDIEDILLVAMPLYRVLLVIPDDIPVIDCDKLNGKNETKLNDWNLLKVFIRLLKRSKLNKNVKFPFG